jgi:hypothetical protein
VVKLRSGEEEQRRLKLGASAEGGRRELGNEGKRCGGGWGWSSPFYRGRGMPGRWLSGSNGWCLMVHAIDGRGRVKEGVLRGGIKRGVETLTWHLYAEAGWPDVAERDGDVAKLGGAGKGKEGANRWGPHASGRRERRR